MYQFNGTSDAFALPDVAGVTDFTIACRFRRLSAQAGQYPCLVGCTNEPATPETSCWYFPAHASFAGEQYYGLRTVGTGGDGHSAQVSLIAVHDVVIRRSGTTATLWIDGVLVLTEAVSSGAITLANLFLAATNAGAVGNFTNCRMGDYILNLAAWSGGNIASFHGGTDPATILPGTLHYHLPLSADHVETVSNATVTVYGSPVLDSSVTYNARVRAGSVKVSPSRNAIACRLETTAFADTNLAAVADGITYSVNGGGPIPLVGPIFKSGNSHDNYVMWGLNPAPVIAIVDDAAATLVGPDWAETAPDGSFESDQYWYYVGHKYHQAADPAATATYTFTGLVAGTYEVHTNATVDPSYSTAARHVVKDSDGTTVVGTFSLDQHGAVPSYDDFDLGMRCHRLGVVTITGTTATVVVSNAGTGVLLVDAIRLKQVFTPKVPPGATVVVSGLDLSISTAAGPIAAFSEPAALATARQWFPYDLSTSPKTTVPGYNLESPNRSSQSLMLADHAPFSSDWTAAQFSSLTTGAHGELTSVTGWAYRVLRNPYGEAIALRDLPNWREGTWRARFSCPGSPPTVEFFDLNQVGRGITFSAVTGPTSVGGGVYEISAYVHFPTGTRRQLRQCYTLAIRTNGVISGLKLFDPDTPSSWTKTVHPILDDHLRGSGMQRLRWMDPLGTNGSSVNDFADYGDPDRVSLESPGTYYQLTVVAVHPVDLTMADADLAQAYMGGRAGSENLCGIKVEFLDPLPWAAGTYKALDFTPVTPRPTYATVLGGGHVAYLHDSEICFVLDSHNVLVCSHFGPGDTAALTTLAASATIGGFAISATAQFVMPIGTMMKVSKELGIQPSFNVPHAARDACVGSLVSAALAASAPGDAISLTYSNEVWNDGLGLDEGPYSGYMSWKSGLGGARGAWYGKRFVDIYNIAKPLFVAAGRLADLRMTVEGHVASDNLIDDILAYIYALAPVDRPPIHEYWVGGYVSGAKDVDGNATLRLDPTGLAELFGVNLTNHSFHDVASLATKFAAKGYTSTQFGIYEGGLDFLNDAEGGDPRHAQRGVVAAADPLMYHGNLAYLHRMNTIGFVNDCRFYRSGPVGQPTASNWSDIQRFNWRRSDPVGTNANPFDYESVDAPLARSWYDWLNPPASPSPGRYWVLMIMEEG